MFGLELGNGWEVEVRFSDDMIDCDISWSLNSSQHRENGPAIEWDDGAKSWFFNGKLHREDGPAVEWASGDREWYWNGKRVTEEYRA